MRIDDVRPPHCHARARRLLAEVIQIRDEMGRSEDGRPALDVGGAHPREVYFAAIATWAKVERLAGELGVRTARFTHVAPDLRDIRPGDVLAVIDGLLGNVELIAQRLHLAERCAEPPVEQDRQPSDVLATLVRVNREVSRALERPFSPGDVYGAVAAAASYAARLGGAAELAPFERGRRPRDCYERLLACQTKVAALIAARGQVAAVVRGTPADVVPGDVYDLASLVAGELAFLYSLTPGAHALLALEPTPQGQRLPADVDQLARTLEAQLAAIK
ncbi:MAG: hypothetical protein KF773_14005 [Deltaproteobacteria bacterium]|nr:hypothetical protein [Deltaproteobacteria bacterium]